MNHTISNTRLNHHSLNSITQIKKLNLPPSAKIKTPIKDNQIRQSTITQRTMLPQHSEPNHLTVSKTNPKTRTKNQLLSMLPYTKTHPVTHS
jgi:hypothetical protein